MDNATLYKTIFSRRAVRKYRPTPLTPGQLGEIRAALANIRQLDGQSARFELVDASAVSDTKAPHYILAYCAEAPAAYMNVGYCLQQMDLYLQSMGLGSLWLGMAKPNTEAEHEPYCIMLAFGETDIPQRTTEADYDRIAPEKISAVDDAVSRAVRLAPSAVNSQPWELQYGQEVISIRFRGRGLLQAVLKKKMSKIDLGIALCHAELALSHENKQIKTITPYADKKNFGIEIVLG